MSDRERERVVEEVTRKKERNTSIVVQEVIINNGVENMGEEENAMQSIESRDPAGNQQSHRTQYVLFENTSKPYGIFFVHYYRYFFKIQTPG